MKRTLTLFALFACGIAQAQPSTFRLPSHYRSAAARATIAVQPGAEAILRNQRASDAAAKSTATAYRLSGWSRFDLVRNEFLDSTSFSYSGSRGSKFLDEKENIHGGDWWYLSAPDHFVSSKDGDPANRYEYESRYNAANQVTEQIFRSKSFTGKSVSSYDASGRISSLLEFDSSSTGWIAERRYTYTYDAAGRRIKDQIVELSSGTPIGIVEYHYNAAGFQDSMQSQRWTGAGWLTDYLMVSQYNAAGLPQLTTNYILTEDMELIPGERMTYSYNANQRLSESISSVFAEGNWELQARDSFGYFGSKALYTYMKSQIRDRDAGTWIDMREWRYMLNAQGQWKTEFFRTQDGRGGLQDDSKTEIRYNAGGLVERTHSYAYDRVKEEFPLTPFEEERFQYQSYQTTGLTHAAAALQLQAYPNPVSSTLRLEVEGAQIDRVDVHSVTGQRVMSLAGAVQGVDMSALAPGTYILHAYLNGGARTKALQVVKN